MTDSYLQLGGRVYVRELEAAACLFCFSKPRCFSGKVRKQSDSLLCYSSVIGAWTKLTVGKTLNIRTGVSHTCG